MSFLSKLHSAETRLLSRFQHSDGNNQNQGQKPVDESVVVTCTVEGIAGSGKPTAASGSDCSLGPMTMTIGDDGTVYCGS
jgi:hypothetical protein